MSRRALITIGVTVWFLSVGLGIREIYSYSTTPGARAPAPEQWPADSALRPADGTHVVLFAHPECPCTRASLSELTAIANAGDATITIVLRGPGDIWNVAARVPGARRVLDPLDHEMQRFGAQTSGHVVVYDARGALRYAGGITGSRGHAGDNAGRQAVLRIVAGADERDVDHAVFGCAL